MDPAKPKRRRPWEVLASLAELAYPGAKRCAAQSRSGDQEAGPANERGPQAA